MPIRIHPRMQRAAMTGLVCLGLLLAACTRSATTATVPTAGSTNPVSSTQGGITQPSDQDATMAAIGTQVAGQLTQTAVASGVGGGQEQTPGAPGTTPEAVATDSQNPGQPTTAPGDTPVAPAPTQAGQPTQPAQPAATATPNPPGAPCPNPYTVQNGDWIYKIARNCGVSVNALIAANPSINPNYISPGQKLNIPAQGVTPAGASDPQGGCSGKHVVTTGESLYGLSFACGLTVEQLAAANNITYPYIIFVGQVLTIP